MAIHAPSTVTSYETTKTVTTRTASFVLALIAPAVRIASVVLDRTGAYLASRPAASAHSLEWWTEELERLLHLPVSQRVPGWIDEVANAYAHVRDMRRLARIASTSSAKGA